MLLQVDEGITSVDQLLDRVVHTDVGLLQESSLHIIRAGGKRLRPRVVFLSHLSLAVARFMIRYMFQAAVTGSVYFHVCPRLGQVEPDLHGLRFRVLAQAMQALDVAMQTPHIFRVLRRPA